MSRVIVLSFLWRFIVEEQKKSSYHVSKKVMLQERDMDIFSFLDRVGYATVEQISRFFFKGDEKHQAALLRRLHLLRRFGYVKSFNTHKGVYFALALKGRGDNALIKSIRLDQLLHHDFLIDLFFECLGGLADVLSERECIRDFKVVGRKGHVPDMVVNDWIIEYERTSKSVKDSKAMAYYWLYEQKRNLCIIYETEEIKRRYSEFLGDEAMLISKKDYKLILERLNGHKSSLSHHGAVLKKYGDRSVDKVGGTIPEVSVADIKKAEDVQGVAISQNAAISDENSSVDQSHSDSKWGNSEDILNRFLSKVKGLSSK
jgi:hypothetical protein